MDRVDFGGVADNAGSEVSLVAVALFRVGTVDVERLQDELTRLRSGHLSQNFAQIATCRQLKGTALTAEPLPSMRIRASLRTGNTSNVVLGKSGASDCKRDTGKNKER